MWGKEISGGGLEKSGTERVRKQREEQDKTGYGTREISL